MMVPKKIDTLLIHQPLSTAKGCFHNTHPIGFFSMADTLEKSGVSCQIVNLAVEKEISSDFSVLEYIRKTQPKVIGIGLHWYIHLYNAIKLAEEIKRAASTKVVFGGYTASVFAKEILMSFPFVDAVIDGEGEIPMLMYSKKILGKIDSFEDVPNLVYRTGPNDVIKNQLRYQATTDDLNSFNYANIQTLKNFRKYFKIATASPIATHYPLPKIPDSIVLLATGRGCENNCYNCGASSTALKTTNFPFQVRYRDPNIVIGEIKEFLSYGYRYFAIVYNPESNYSYYLRLFEAIRRENIKIGLIFDAWFLPPQDFINSFIATFDLNYSALGLTIESGSARIRSQIGKVHNTNEEICNFVEEVNKNRLFTNIHFTVGLPDETKEDVNDTLRMMDRLKKAYGHIIVNAIPLEPASPMAVQPEKFRITAYRKTLQDYFDFARDMAAIKYPRHPLGYATEHFSEMSLQKLKLGIFCRCYMNWRYLKLFLKVNDKKRLLAKLFSWLGVVTRSPRLFYKYTPGTIC